MICDRAVLDNYAYLIHQAGRQGAYEALVASWLETYDALFKVPIIEPPQFDGRRDVSIAFQRAIDASIDSLLVEFGVTATPLLASRRGHWVDDALTVLGLPLHPPQVDLFGAEPGRADLP